MTSAADVFLRAVVDHQAGRVAAAERGCLQVLAMDPEHVDALHLLGVIHFQRGELELAAMQLGRAAALNGAEPAFQLNLGNVFQAQGKWEAALACYRRAVELLGDLPEAHYNLGTAHLKLGKFHQAVDCFRRATELNPELAEAHNNLGLAWQATGALDKAVASYVRALALQPQFAEAHNNLGNCCHARGDLDASVIHYERALALKPDYAEALYNLGNAWQVQGRFEQAIDWYRRALAIAPNYAAAYTNLGNALKGLGDCESAVNCFRRVVELRPGEAEAHYNLGEARLAAGDPEGAAECCGRALELNPQHVEAHFNLANAHRQLGNFSAADEGFERTLALKPDYADARFNRSMLMLLRGDWEQGWAEYEWRWRTRQLPERGFQQPRWDGGPLEERTILLHAEQGLGDTLQFVRYAKVVKQQNPSAAVVLECQRSLYRLLAGCPDIDRLVAAGDELPAFDVHLPLLSLPGVLKTTLATIPANVPYLFADAALVAYWRERLRDAGGLRIGIHWQGRGGQGEFRQRDIPLEHFFPLGRFPGVRLVSLQKGARLGAPASTAVPIEILDFGSDLDTLHGPFMDTAAIMVNLDLVITSDTSIPHLAGALGVPVWLALPLVPDWRWLLERSDSPWYPTMRLFRQKSAGDWLGVFSEIAAALDGVLQRGSVADLNP